MQCFLSTCFFSLRIFEDSKIQKGVQTITPKGNYPRLGLGIGQGLALELGLGAKFPREKANCPRIYENVDL